MYRHLIQWKDKNGIVIDKACYFGTLMLMCEIAANWNFINGLNYDSVEIFKD